MPAFHQPPLNIVVAVALWAGALVSAVRGVRLLARGLREHDHRERPTASGLYRSCGASERS